MLFEQAAEIDAVAARIDEGVEFGLGRDREHRPFDAVAFDLQRADDVERVGRRLEIDQRDRIAEHVVHPAHDAGRRQRQLGATSRRSWLSRGRSISRCGPNVTGRA